MTTRTFARPAAAAGAGTVALVIWGMLFWGLLAGPLGMFHALPRASEVTALLEGTPTGTYFVPWPRDTPEAFERFVEHHRRGAFYELRYVREGVDPQSAGKILAGTLQYAAVAALAVALALLVGPGRLRRAAAVLLAGLAGSLFITVAQPLWFHLPWDHTAGELLYELVSWALLALAASRA